MAWLHATPEESKTSRREQIELSPAQQYLLDMPDVSPAEYLLDLWNEAGTVTQNGMGISGLTWEELIKWANKFYSQGVFEYVEVDPGVFAPQTTQVSTISDFELLLIKHVSDAYAGEYSASSAKDRQAPYQPVFTPDFDRAAVAVQVRSVMGSIMAQQAQLPQKKPRK